LIFLLQLGKVWEAIQPIVANIRAEGGSSSTSRNSTALINNNKITV